MYIIEKDTKCNIYRKEDTDGFQENRGKTPKASR